MEKVYYYEYKMNEYRELYHRTRNIVYYKKFRMYEELLNYEQERLKIRHSKKNH